MDNTVEVIPFFSQLYQDSEAEFLSRRLTIQVEPEERIPFSFDEFLEDSCRMILTLGDAEAEQVAEALLIVCAITNQIMGVAKEELYRFFEGSHGRTLAGQWEIQNLIKDGFLREKFIKTILVLFPTEKLLREVLAHKERYPYCKKGLAAK